MNELIKKLNGANMDIDLATPKSMITWEQDKCPWNKAEETNIHHCAVRIFPSAHIFVASSIWIRFYVVTRIQTRLSVKINRQAYPPPIL